MFQQKGGHSEHRTINLFETLYKFSDNFVTLLSNTWFRINKTLSVFTNLVALCIAYV